MEDRQDVTEQLKEVAQLFGTALIVTQTCEQMLGRAVFYVLGEHASLRDALDYRNKSAKMTLGQLLAALRKKVDVEPGLDDRLSNFLEERNKLAHRLHDVPGLDFDTQEGLKAAHNFAMNLFTESTHIHNIFAAYVRDWQKAVGIEINPKYDLSLLDDIADAYRDVAFASFRPKVAKQSD